jgi:hypothetical protein
LIEVRLEVDELPTNMERVMEYIRSLFNEVPFFPELLTTLGCMIGAVVLLFFIKSRRQADSRPVQWRNTAGVLKRKVVEKQSEIMNKPNVAESTVYVNCKN